MNLQWNTRKVAERPEPDFPPIWLFVVFFFAVQGVGILIAIAQWPDGKAISWSPFLFQATFLPFLFFVAVCGAVVYAGYEMPWKGAVLWNLMCQWRNYHWLCWTRDHVVLVDSVVMTPEDEIAERMLGLEGRPPDNVGKAVTFDFDLAPGEARIEHLLRNLLASLLPALQRMGRTESIQIVLQSEDQDDLTVLRRVLAAWNLPGHPTLVWQSPGQPDPMDSLWVEHKPMSGVRLFIACQLGRAGAEPPYSEMAVAMLFADASALARNRHGLRPQACLYRPVVAESDEVDRGIAMLLGSEPVAAGRIRQFWLTGLNKPLRHAVTVAVKDAALRADTQDIDQALGKPGHANGWVAQSLAAKMVRHGQGAQLVAIPCKSGVAVNIVANRPESPDRPGEDRVVPFSLMWATAMIAMAVFVGNPGVADGDADRTALLPWWAAALFAFAGMALQVASELLYYRLLSREFDEACYPANGLRG
ncbi:hypothetical protein D9X30_1859 [Cupriavidus sp. U2]|uniref:hypothetical protein n=1 Tax=Cupriavidus sp. U2 TaxID=2920269 RepID=UPI00129E19C9|nr:hypothetical protein [Cupriavidus sp. U2]KAI3592988.1 hypothetical protein D9X30_1859 [Cupriavidus sp. U2]